MSMSKRAEFLTFQSTRPARGATLEALCQDCHNKISIHAPREGRDFLLLFCTDFSTDFNPRAPRGARLIANLEGLSLLSLIHI